VQNASSARQAFIASRVVTAGSINVTVTYSNSGDQRSAVFVWLLRGYNSATPTDTSILERHWLNHGNAGYLGGWHRGLQHLPLRQRRYVLEHRHRERRTARRRATARGGR
jgi:hypothetical protein